jgi:subtilisin family serine protease
MRLKTAFVAACALLLVGCAVDPLSLEVTTRLPAQVRADADRQLVVTIREADASLVTPAGATPKTYGDPARYRPSSFARRIADELAEDYDLAWVADWRIEVLGVHCVVYSAPDPKSRSEAVRRLKNDRRVETVQPMNEFRTAAKAVAYDDPYFRLQNQVQLIRVPEAHRWSRGRGVRVAVIDTGVDLRHPDLARRVRLARNFVDADAAAYGRDAHGTAVAGVIAATMNNGQGIVGVAPEVEILALKACWHASPTAPAICNTLTLAEALAFAIERRAAVINLSLTGPDDPLLRRLVGVALSRGCVVVGADPGSVEDGESFPLAVPGVLAVADADERGVDRSRARIAAPGHDILTLAPSGRYDYLSGASLSSAMVSGIAALLLEMRRSLTPGEVALLMEHTASNAPGPRPLVNACKALASLVSTVTCDEGDARLAGGGEHLP